MLNKKNSEIFAALLLIVVFTIAVYMTSFVKPVIKDSKPPDIISVEKSVYKFGDGRENKVISTDTEFAPDEYNYNSFRLSSSSLTVKASSKVSPFIIRAKESIVIDKDARLIASGSGYLSASESSTENLDLTVHMGRGGDGMGLGGLGDCLSQDTAAEDKSRTFEKNIIVEYGEAGTTGKPNLSFGGRGGGYILLIAPRIVIEGDIYNDGLAGKDSGGGGGGGKTAILGNDVNISGKLFARGGAGGSSQIQGAGGGGGGLLLLPEGYRGPPRVDISGGKGGMAYDLYTGCDGRSGQEGELLLYRPS